MPRPIPRHTFERRARIRRTIQLRRRRQVRQASIVALSLTVLLASGLTVFFIARTVGVNARATPLYALTPDEASIGAPLVQRPTPAPAVEAAAPTPVVKPAAPAARPASEPKLESAGVEADDASTLMFNGRPIKPVRTIRMLVTAYSPDARSCGKFADGITASGYSVWTNGGKLVAADTRVLPFGSLIRVPGYDSGQIVPVLDVGGKIKGHRLDVLFPTHEQARQWGKKWLDVTVYDYAD